MSDEFDHRLIDGWRAGDGEAIQRLLPFIYEELRRVARRHLRGQRPDHTLQSMALIHEAYLRMAGKGPPGVNDQRHFVALASRIMRQVLVDHARARLADKRDGGLRVTLTQAGEVADQKHGVEVLAIDEALERLAQFDPQQARVVEMRFFGGLSIAEAALELGISESTVKREWTMARAWLRSELQHRDGS